MGKIKDVTDGIKHSYFLRKKLLSKQMQYIQQSILHLKFNKF